MTSYADYHQVTAHPGINAYNVFGFSYSMSKLESIRCDLAGSVQYLHIQCNKINRLSNEMARLPPLYEICIFSLDCAGVLKSPPHGQVNRFSKLSKVYDYVCNYGPYNGLGTAVLWLMRHTLGPKP